MTTTLKNKQKAAEAAAAAEDGGAEPIASAESMTVQERIKQREQKEADQEQAMKDATERYEGRLVAAAKAQEATAASLATEEAAHAETKDALTLERQRTKTQESCMAALQDEVAAAASARTNQARQPCIGG